MRKITLSKCPNYLSDMFQYKDTPYEALMNMLSAQMPRTDLYKTSRS